MRHWQKAAVRKKGRQPCPSLSNEQQVDLPECGTRICLWHSGTNEHRLAGLDRA